GSLIVAVLLAFAVFAAAVDRDDVALEYRRLRVHGAGRLQLATFVAAEAAIPAVIGAILGWLGAAAIVGLIGVSQGAPLAALPPARARRPPESASGAPRAHGHRPRTAAACRDADPAGVQPRRRGLRPRPVGHPPPGRRRRGRLYRRHGHSGGPADRGRLFRGR